MAYELGPVKPFVQDVADTVGPALGVTSIGGWRATAHDMQGHPAGLALDFMVGGDKPKGQAVANYFERNAARFHVRYLIWQQRIWSPATPTWKLMETRPGTKPGYDPNHLRHVHVSFTTDVNDGRRLSGGAIDPSDPAVQDAFNRSVDDMHDGAPSSPLDALGTLTARSTWLSVLQVVGGSIAVVIGIGILARDVIGPAVSTVAGAMPQGRAAKALAGIGAATTEGG